MKKIGNIVRYSIGILFIIGMFGMASDSVLAGIFMGLFGVSLLPVVYDNFIYSNLKLDKRSYLHIIIPILLFLGMCVFMPETEFENNADNTVNNNVVNEEKVKDDDKTEEKETTEKNLTENETSEENVEENTIEEENKAEENKQEEPKDETTNTKPSIVAPTQQTNTFSDNRENENKEETTTPSTPTVTITPQPEPQPESTPEPEPGPQPTPKPEPQQTPSETIINTNSQTYILNNNTKKFHEASCGSASRIKEANKSTFTGSRDELIARGYSPCGNCNP